MSTSELRKVNQENEEPLSTTETVDDKTTDRNKYNYDKNSEDITKKSLETQRLIDKKIELIQN